MRSLVRHLDSRRLLAQGMIAFVSPNQLPPLHSFDRGSSLVSSQSLRSFHGELMTTWSIRSCSSRRHLDPTQSIASQSVGQCISPHGGLPPRTGIWKGSIHPDSSTHGCFADRRQSKSSNCLTKLPHPSYCVSRFLSFQTLSKTLSRDMKCITSGSCGYSFF